MTDSFCENLAGPMRQIAVAATCVWFGLLAAGHLHAVEANGVVEDFALSDCRGREYRLSEFENRPVVVVAFLGVECPLAKLYAGRLQRLAKDYADKGVVVLGIDSNRQDAPTEIAAYVRRQGIEFPVLIDVGSRLAGRMGATRTPEVFVLDSQRVVRYRGRIDDQYGVGVARTAPGREELHEALDAVLRGTPVGVAKTEPVGCLIGRPREPDEKSGVTWSNQISRIFQKRCQECHREGDIGPFSLLSYDDAAGWGEMIGEVVREGRMPPWHANPAFGHFANSRELPADEKAAILAWVTNGCPRGDTAELPPPRVFTSGWQTSRTPDEVLAMAPTPFQIPAEAGPEGVRYQNFWVDPQFTEDKWISEAQVVPGNAGVVHHVIVYVHPDKDNQQVESFLTAYVPGLRPRRPDAGYAQRIPAGARLRFQVHYTPNGTPQEDISKVGFVYSDPADVKYEVMTTEAADTKFKLQPFQDEQEVVARSRKAREDITMLAMAPHMHLRGKSFRYELEFPDGRRETLLDVPRYDFSWQTAYELAEPFKIPAGARIICTARYDNSEKNLNNPDPSATVQWGDQSWDEMMIGYFDIVVPKRDRASSKPIGPAAPEDSALGKLDKNDDGVISRTEAQGSFLFRTFFDRFDSNKDDVLDTEEIGKVLKQSPKADGRRPLLQ